MDYAAQARVARIAVLNMIHAAQSSHIGSNFSCIDILTVLFEHMNVEQDEFICSKGWVAASVYYFLAEKGIIPKEHLERYCKEGEETYIGLIEPQGKFGLRAAGGAVGYGLSFAVGFALSKKLKDDQGKVYVLLSDGEMDCGMVWESAKVAVKYKLDNLIAIVDNNGFQATGRKTEILPTGNLFAIWNQLGWNAQPIDGHDFSEIHSSLLSSFPNLPKILLANTTKGKGVSFMENKLEWHYRNVTPPLYQQAVTELCISKARA